MKKIFSLFFILTLPAVSFANGTQKNEVRVCVHNPDDRIKAWSVREDDYKEFAYYPSPPAGYSCIIVETNEFSFEVTLELEKGSCAIPVLSNKDSYLNLAQCEHRQKGMQIPASLLKDAPTAKSTTEEKAEVVKHLKGICDGIPAEATNRQQTSCLSPKDFNSMDKDKDGTLKKKELTGAYQDMKGLDTNKDGKVDILEFMNAQDQKLKKQ